jgi:hAT family C-terminal dimerisation region
MDPAIDYLSSFQFDAATVFDAQQEQPATSAFGQLQPEENTAMLPEERCDISGHMEGGMSGESSPEKLLPFAKETARMLVDDMHSPSILDGRGFQTFAATLYHGYRPIPRRSLLAELEVMFSQQAAQVALLLSKSERFALSVELWRSAQGKRVFATVHAHCVDQEKPLILHVHHGEPCNSTADESTVEKAVSETMRAWKIEETRVISITSPSDATSRQFPAVLTHILGLHCVFQRAMSQAIARHKAVIVRVKDTVGADDSAVVDATRHDDWLAWCKVVRQCAKADPLHHIAIQEDIATAASLWSLLRPARKAADAISAEQGFLPLSVARFHLENVLEAATKVSIGRDIDHAVRGTAFHVAQTISDALSSWRAEDRADTMLLSSLLDPRHKSLALSTSSSRYGMPEEEAFDLLRRHCAAELSRLDAMSGIGLVDKEVRAYLSLDSAASGTPVRRWWATEKTKFPTLALVARKVLCVPSTSAPAPRIFEASAGNSAPDSFFSRRLALCSQSDVSPAYVQTLVFLHGNANF